MSMYVTVWIFSRSCNRLKLEQFLFTELQVMQRFFYGSVWGIIFYLVLSVGAACAIEKKSKVTWMTLQPGLEFATAMPAITAHDETVENLPASATDYGFVFLRIDPAQFEFTLHMASEVGAAYSLTEWAQNYGLVAGINASMYLQDNTTSIGYLRNAHHVNNPRVAGKLGAFLVASPKAGEKGENDASLALVDILERSSIAFEERLQQYDIVVQNYRLVSKEGRVLWPEGGVAHSIAVIAKDTQGKILFILCRMPLTPVIFAANLQHFALSLTTVMYVEGGAQAGLFLQKEGLPTTWMGRVSILNAPGNSSAPLPNILGVRKKK